MKIKESKIYTVLFTFIITFVFVFALAYTNHVTKDTVKKNQELFQIKAILKAMQISFTNNDHAYALYQSDISSVTVTNAHYTNVTLFSSGSGSDKIWAVVFKGDALWGTITGVLSVDPSVERSMGLAFIDQNETPGLGGRIEEDWFLDQFHQENLMARTNASGQVERMITVKLGRTDRVGDPDKSNGEVDGISGASLTSAGVHKAVNKTIPLLVELIGELNNE